MNSIAIIGGTGLTSFAGLEIVRKEVVRTPYGTPSAPLTYGQYCGKQIIFLPRHGSRHNIPPHMINYRANLWAMHDKGVQDIIAVAAVGGIDAAINPTKVVIPEQIIDYTYGRQQTFFEKDLVSVKHVDFSQPYDARLRQHLLTAGHEASLELFAGGVYGVTQGPRLETAAEIDRLERDGCQVVGMTGMPEAALARELGINYAHCAVAVNWAAGRGEQAITLESIQQCTQQGMIKVRSLLAALMATL